jgi:hypothetical protein
MGPRAFRGCDRGGQRRAAITLNRGHAVMTEVVDTMLGHQRAGRRGMAGREAVIDQVYTDETGSSMA